MIRFSLYFEGPISQNPLGIRQDRQLQFVYLWHITRKLIRSILILNMENEKEPKPNPSQRLKTNAKAADVASQPEKRIVVGKRSIWLFWY